MGGLCRGDQKTGVEERVGARAGTFVVDPVTIGDRISIPTSNVRIVVIVGWQHERYIDYDQQHVDFIPRL